MDVIDLFIYSATKYYDFIRSDENGRYRSWEHCYYNFCCARNNKDIDYDYLSLQLAFYLASWGMYRGSSFLLQKDYKVHIHAVKEIMKEEYAPLVGITCSDIVKEQNLKLLDNLKRILAEYYDSVRKTVKDKDVKNQLSDTLITKILMGTLGCVPAYDRYFIAGVRANKISTGIFNVESVEKLAKFYENNKEWFEVVREGMSLYDMEYPQMKLVDMGFWQIGFDMSL